MQVDNPRLTADMARLLDDHFCRFPDSEISQAVIEWYNAEYTALEDIEPYQVCPDSEENGAPETLTDVIDIISGFVSGKPRRVGRAAIRIICREATRSNAIRTSSEVE